MTGVRDHPPVDPAGDAEALEAARRIERFTRTRDPLALWPGLAERERMGAARELERVTRARLAGERVVALDPEVRHRAYALGVAGQTTGMGPVIGGWIERGLVTAREEVREPFVRHLEHGRRRAERMQRGVLPALDALIATGITPMVLKGLHTGRVYFDEPGARRMSDVDLAVPAELIGRAEDALRRAGFRAHGETARPYKRDWIAPAVDPRVFSVEFTDARSGWVVELQSSLDRRVHAGAEARLDGERQRSEPMEIAGRTVLVPRPDLLLLLLACHCAQELDGTRLLRLYEIVQLVRRERAAGRLAWPEFSALLNRTGAARFAYPALDLAERLAPGAIDAGVLARVRAESTWAARHTVPRLVPAGGSIDSRSLVQQVMWVRGPWAVTRRALRHLWPAEGWRVRWRRMREGGLSVAAADERAANSQRGWRLLASVMTRDQRRAAAGLLAMMVVGAVFETLGVGLVIPALAFMTQPAAVERYPVVRSWLAREGGVPHARLIAAGLLALVAVYAVKAVFLAVLARREGRFLAALQVELSRRLFGGFLRQPYTFHLQRNPAQLAHAIAQVRDVTTAAQSYLLLFTEGLVMAGLAALLVWIEPAGAAMVGFALGTAAWMFNRATIARLVRAGRARQAHDARRIRHIEHGLGGVKELIVLGREREILAQFDTDIAGSARADETLVAVAALPRIALELLTVMAVAGLVLVMLARGRTPAEIVPVMGVFAAAAFRLMPSVGRILTAQQRIRFHSAGVEAVRHELRQLSAPPADGGSAVRLTRAITVEGVSFRYPSVAAPTLTGVWATIPRGACVGIVGESGAGKTTLVDLIIGLLTPDAGEIRVDGGDIRPALASWQRQVGYVPQSVFLSDESLRANVAFGVAADAIDEAAVRRAVHDAGLSEVVAGLSGGLDAEVGERGVRLSGGERQRIGIARALYHDPAVLVLDEATNALDEETERAIMQTVRALRGRTTVLIVAHRPATVRECDVLLRVERGAVVQSTVPGPAS